MSAAARWTRPSDLVAQVRKRWDRGELLSAMVSDEPVFPLRLGLRPPTSTDLTEHFEDVRAWVAELREMKHVRLQMREFRHRIRGASALPEQAWLDSLEDALALIQRGGQAAAFRRQFDVIRQRQPALTPWLQRHPLRALELRDRWPRLLDVIDWLQRNPRPGLYLRQVDIPGVDSKFIERHRAVLSELLDLALPASAIDPGARGAGGFIRRYGFQAKPMQLRFRLLDPELALLPGVRGGDITLDADSFRMLRCPVTRVFITENEINFLAFPEVPGAMVLFGAGYGFQHLDGCEWLQRCELYYWGDIDTHGFAILDQLRRRFSHVRSLLMDRATLLAHRELWGEENTPITHDLGHLGEDERALYDALRDQRLGQRNVRLEQELIGFAWVRQALEELPGPD